MDTAKDTGIKSGNHLRCARRNKLIFMLGYAFKAVQLRKDLPGCKRRG